jgi:hypothetical protein
MATWTITNMTTLPDVVGKIDFVWNVFWLCTVTTTDGKTASMAASVMLDPEVVDPNYTPYDQLTEAQVVGWVQTTLGPTRVTQTETVLLQQAEAVTLPLPWSV